MFVWRKYWLTSWETKWYCGMELWQWGWNVRFLMFLHPTQQQPAYFSSATACLLPLSSQCVFFITEWSRLVELSWANIQASPHFGLWVETKACLLSESNFVAKWLFSSACAQTGLSGCDNLCLMLSSSFFSFSSMDVSICTSIKKAREYPSHENFPFLL